MRTKTPEKKTSGGNANALQKPLQPSEELAAVVGSGPISRGAVVSKIWDYIRSHDLQNPENRPRYWPTTSSGRSFARTR
jgi:chromatin remodeling complex protein RSC6